MVAVGPAARLPRGPRSSTADHPFGLTAREAEVLALLAGGKLGVQNRREAAVLARREGLG